MRFLTGVLTAATLLVLSAPGVAQVYKTKDKEGNTVFTDVPTQGAKEVDVQTTNTANAPPDIHPAPTREKAPQATGSASQQGAQEGDVVIIGNKDNDLVGRAIEEHRRGEVRDAVEAHATDDGEGGQAELLRRVPPATQPHAVPHKQ